MAENKSKTSPGKPSTGTGADPGKGFEEVKRERRIRDAAQARELFNRFKSDNRHRSAIAARVRGQLEGDRPYDEARLKENGTAWQTNVNFGDSQAARDRTLLPYWKMVHDVPHVFSVTIDSGSPNTSQFEALAQQNLNRFIKDWGADYFIHYMAGCKNYVDFGLMLAHWDDDEGPRWKSANVNRVYFPKNARMSPDEWDIIMFTRDMTVGELWGKVRDKRKAKTSEEAGWNTKAVKAAIVKAWSGGDRTAAGDEDYTRVSDELVNNDLAASDTRFSPVRVVWAYARGFDGKISCHAFTEEACEGNKDDFLFESEDYAETFSHVFGPVWYDTGSDGMAHSVKGFSVKNFHYAVMLNRIKSRMIDSATFALGINFTRDSEDVPDETPPVENYGAVTVFPTGLTQLAVYPQLQQAQAVVTALQDNQAHNNSQYRDQNTKQIQQTETAKQAEILAAMQGEMNEAAASIYLSQVGRNILTEVVRRLRMRGSRDADAKLFQKRMKDAGVPEQIVFEADWLIETGANAGMASAAVRLQKAQQLAGMQNMPDMNGRAIRELLVTQLAGANAVKQFMLPAGGQGEPEQLRAALQENADFMQGLQLPAAPSDNHTVHLTVHLQSAGQIVMATDPLVARGQLPNGNAMRALMAGLEHAKQHLGFMGMDETRAKERKVFQDQFAMLESKAQKFMTAIARAQQQAQQQQAMRNAAAIEAGRRVEAQRLAVAQKERAEGPNGGRAEGLNGGGTQGEDAGL